IRSSMLLPRRRVGACSPRTHRIASTTLDLPQPLGPTTAVIPGAKLIVVESRKDLKPSNSRLLRRMLPSPPPHHHHVSEKFILNYPQRVKRTRNISWVAGPISTASCGGRLGIADFANSGTLILDQLGVPIGAVDLRQVRHPFAVAPQAEHLGPKRRPFGASRPAEEMHPGLVRRAATLA